MNSHMKVVYIISRKILKVNTRIFKQASSLCKAGYRVTVIGILAEGLLQKEEKDGYTIIRINLKPPRFLRRTKLFKKDTFKFDIRIAICGGRPSRLRLLLKRVRNLLMPLYRTVTAIIFICKAYTQCRRCEVIDIVHANDLDALPAAYFIAKKHNAKLLYDAQELYPELHIFSRFDRMLLSGLEAFFVKKADKVVTVNEFIADEIEKRYKVKVDERIINCPSYISIDENGYRKKDIRSVLNIPPDIPILLYSGGLSPRRGIENTILSLRYLLRNLIFVILGSGRIKGELQALVRQCQLHNRVFFYDYIPHEEVPSFIRSATIGIVPYENVGLNHYYCSPSKLFHYIMGGLPVAVSNYPFLRKVVLGNGIGAVFDANDPRNIAQTIDAVLEDNEYARYRSNVANIRKKYCWENEELRFLKLYENLTKAGA